MYSPLIDFSSVAVISKNYSTFSSQYNRIQRVDEFIACFRWRCL